MRFSSLESGEIFRNQWLVVIIADIAIGYGEAYIGDE